MATDNSNNNTTLDIALEELLNNTEFRQQYDTTYIRPTTTEIETTSSSNTINAHENVSSTETTPNSLNIAYLHPLSDLQICDLGQTTKEVYSSLDDIVETITLEHSEIIPPSTSMKQTIFHTPMKASTGTMPMSPAPISTVTQSTNTPFMQSIGTMPITPTGYKSIGTLPMTPPGSKTTEHSYSLRSALLRAVCYCSTAEDFHQERLYLELTYLVNGYSFFFVESHVQHFFDYYETQSIRYCSDQINYHIFRRRWFEFFDFKQERSKKLQELDDKNKVIHFNYIYDYGPRCEFNQDFLDRWSTTFAYHPTLSPDNRKVILTTKYIHSLNTLLSPRK
ncbi:hypothetical protein I4U23_005668 [Adineta vaga]|nr:hypothetical protein I4U23_005668 [Adineta vaga]